MYSLEKNSNITCSEKGFINPSRWRVCPIFVARKCRVMHVRVHLAHSSNAFDPDTGNRRNEDTVELQCGPGEQILRWLAYAACSRFAYQQGKVRRSAYVYRNYNWRARFSSNHEVQGFPKGMERSLVRLLTVCFNKVPAAVVPQAIVLKDGGVADPDLVLNEVHALRV